MYLKGSESYIISHFLSEKTEEQTYQKYLKECNKIVYAIGYQRKRLPVISIDNKACLDNEIDYNDVTGTI